MAHLSGDAGLIEAFRSGEDLHRFVGVAGLRRRAATTSPASMRAKIKAMNYGLAYGLSAYGLSQQLAHRHRRGARADGRVLRALRRRARLPARASSRRPGETGYTETILGRRRYLPDLTSDNRQRREMAERMALNAPIQGSAADIIKVAMLGVERGAARRAGARSRMLLQVHDELVLEIAPGERDDVEALVRREMGSRRRAGRPARRLVGVGQPGTTPPTETRRPCSGVPVGRRRSPSREEPAPQWATSRPRPRCCGRPLGLDEVDEVRPAAATRGPGRRGCGGARRRSPAPVVALDVGGAVEVGRGHRQPRSAGSSGNAQRSGWVVENTNRPPGRSTRAASRMTAAESATKGTAPYAVKTMSMLASAKGRASRVALQPAGRPRRGSRAVSGVEAALAQHRRRQVASPTTCAARPASQREHCAAPAPISRTRRPRTSPSRLGVGLAQPLRAPDEVVVPEEARRARRGSRRASASHQRRLAEAVSGAGPLLDAPAHRPMPRSWLFHGAQFLRGCCAGTSVRDPAERRPVDRATVCRHPRDPQSRALACAFARGPRPGHVCPRIILSTIGVPTYMTATHGREDRPSGRHQRHRHLRKTSSPRSTRRSSTSTTATSSRVPSSRSTGTRSCSTSATRPRASSPPASCRSSTTSTRPRSSPSATRSRPSSSRRRTRKAA